MDNKSWYTKYDEQTLTDENFINKYQDINGYPGGNEAVENLFKLMIESDSNRMEVETRSWMKLRNDDRFEYLGQKLFIKIMDALIPYFKTEYIFIDETEGKLVCENALKYLAVEKKYIITFWQRENIKNYHLNRLMASFLRLHHFFICFHNTITDHNYHFAILDMDEDKMQFKFDTLHPLFELLSSIFALFLKKISHFIRFHPLESRVLMRIYIIISHFQSSSLEEILSQAKDHCSDRDIHEIIMNLTGKKPILSGFSFDMSQTMAISYKPATQVFEFSLDDERGAVGINDSLTPNNLNKDKMNESTVFGGGSKKLRRMHGTGSVFLKESEIEYFKKGSVIGGGMLMGPQGTFPRSQHQPQAEENHPEKPARFGKEEDGDYFTGKGISGSSVRLTKEKPSEEYLRNQGSRSTSYSEKPRDPASIMNSQMFKSSPNKPMNSMVYKILESRDLLEEFNNNSMPTEKEVDQDGVESDEDEEARSIQEETNWERKTFGRLSIGKRQSLDAKNIRSVQKFGKLTDAEINKKLGSHLYDNLINYDGEWKLSNYMLNEQKVKAEQEAAALKEEILKLEAKKKKKDKISEFKLDDLTHPSKNDGENQKVESKREKSNASSSNNLDPEYKKKETANRRKSGVKESDLVNIDENTVIKGDLIYVFYKEPPSKVLLDEEILYSQSSETGAEEKYQNELRSALNKKLVKKVQFMEVFTEAEGNNNYRLPENNSLKLFDLTGDEEPFDQLEDLRKKRLKEIVFSALGEDGFNEDSGFLVRTNNHK